MRITLVAIVLFLGCNSNRERESQPLAAFAKSCAQHGDLSCPVPIFNVKSLRESQQYFHNALGFKIEWDYGDPPDFGAVSRGHAVIFMCEKCQSSPGAWMMTFTKDVDRLYEEFKKRGAIIKMPPTNMEWNLREMHVADPDDNVIRFGGPIEHE